MAALCLSASAAPILQSGWTTTTDPATARTALGVPSASDMLTTIQTNIPPLVIAISGDSINTSNSAIGFSWAQYFATNVFNYFPGPIARLTNYARESATLGQMIGDYPTQAGGVGVKPTGNQRGIFISDGGLNDIFTTLRTHDEVITDQSNLVRMARADGYKVMWINMVPYFGGNAISSARSNIWWTVNRDIAAGTNWDWIVRPEDLIKFIGQTINGSDIHPDTNNAIAIARNVGGQLFGSGWGKIDYSDTYSVNNLFGKNIRTAGGLSVSNEAGGMFVTGNTLLAGIGMTNGSLFITEPSSSGRNATFALGQIDTGVLYGFRVSQTNGAGTVGIDLNTFNGRVDLHVSRLVSLQTPMQFYGDGGVNFPNGAGSTNGGAFVNLGKTAGMLRVGDNGVESIIRSNEVITAKLTQTGPSTNSNSTFKQYITGNYHVVPLGNNSFTLRTSTDSGSAVALSPAISGIYFGNTTSERSLHGAEGSGILQIGDDAASPIAHTLKGNDSRAGTDTDTIGANLTLSPGRGTGTAGSGTLIFQTGGSRGTGTAATVMSNQVWITSTGALVGTNTDTAFNGFSSRSNVFTIPATNTATANQVLIATGTDGSTVHTKFGDVPDISGIKYYEALLTVNVSGTITSVNVLKNTTGGTINWATSATGQYDATSTVAGVFPRAKTLFFVGNPNKQYPVSTEGIAEIEWDTDDGFLVYLYDTAGAPIHGVNYLPISIKIYP